MKILCLDPSVNNVGWALFDSSKKSFKKAWTFGTWKLTGNNYQMRLVDLKDRIVEEIGEFQYLVTEWPAFYSSEKGAIAAHQNYTIDLAGICMYIAGWFRLDHRTHQPITAIAWKGSVPKAVTSRKFFRVFKIKVELVSEHAIDATMLLYYWLEFYGPTAFRAAGLEYPVSLLSLASRETQR